jgi:DNA polymerase III alpha subunit
MEYTVETRTDGRKAMRVGLMQVHGLRIETIGNVIRARSKEGKFRSLEDFLGRVVIERDEIETLIKCGAFDEVGDEVGGDFGRATRPALLWRLNLLQARRTLPATPATSLFNEPANWCGEKAAIPEHLPDYTREQRLRYERELLEVCVSGHPLDFLPRNGEVWSDELAGKAGQRVTLCGWVVTYRHVGTKNYRNMMFVTLEDQRGIFETVLFPEAYERYGRVVFETRTVKVTGRIEPGGQLNCESLTALKQEKR